MPKQALWPARWPLIAHHVLDNGKTCVESVNEVPEDEKAEVAWLLPCDDCPENVHCLNAKKKEIAGLLYDREWMTRPRGSESTYFPMDLFESSGTLLPDEAMVQFWEKPFSVEEDYGVASAWDIAWSERTGGDYLVKMTGYVHRPTGKRRILDILRTQRLTFKEQVELMETQHELFHDDVVVIEEDAAQRIWRQDIEANTDVPVLGHASSKRKDGSGDDKKSLAVGVPSLVVALQTRRWQIPYMRGGWHHENVEQFLVEAEAFGWNDGKLEGVGEHDDCVMAWWHLSWALDLLEGQGMRQRRLGIQRGAYI